MEPTKSLSQIDSTTSNIPVVVAQQPPSTSSSLTWHGRTTSALSSSTSASSTSASSSAADTAQQLLGQATLEKPESTPTTPAVAISSSAPSQSQSSVDQVATRTIQPSEKPEKREKAEEINNELTLALEKYDNVALEGNSEAISKILGLADWDFSQLPTEW